MGPDDRRTAKAQRTLGVCLAALGNRAEAKRLLLASWRTLSQAKNWYHRTLGTQNLKDFVSLYDSMGNRAEAAKYLELLRGEAVGKAVRR